MKNIIKMISVSLISLIVAFSPANASSGVFKLSHDLGFGKDTNLDAITKGRLFQVVIMTQNRLVRKNLDGVTSPELATDWSGNSDATEWTFNLRKGVKFHDGSDFDAEDVKYSLMRVKDPDIGSPAKKSMSSVTDIEVVDSHTVKMKLNTSFADFPLLLTDYRLRMIPNGSGDTIGKTGIGTRGPGETKLETDNRLIDNRINKLKREIKKVSKQREVQSSFRKKNNTPLVSIVGYTNAGKSTMLEKITSSKTYVANELFATVDSLQRELKIDGINEHIILSDTVGFIQNLPTTLIESFKSTLTVVKEAYLLIHVVDAASAIPEMHINTVHEILDQIEANVPEILVFNKIDRIDKASLNYLTEKYPDAIFVSSTKGTNIEKLISEITTNVFGNLNEVSLIISPKDLDQLHKYSSIVSVKNVEEGLEVTVEIRNYYLENLLQKDVVKLLS